MNSSIMNIDFDPTHKYCHICDQTMNRKSTIKHCKTKSHNVNLLIDQFDKSFNILDAFIYINNNIPFLNMNEDHKIIYIRKQLAL